MVRIAGAIATLLLGFALAELAVRVLDLAPAARALASIRPDDGPEAPAPQALFRAQIHPYWGWSFRPGSEIDPMRAALGQAPVSSEGATRLNRLGFASSIADYRDLEPDRFSVGILGGSVAMELVMHGSDAMVAALTARSPDLAGRVDVVNLASAAYKQPQQLMVLTQMTLLGVSLDAVVNLDGYNELALGLADAHAGHHPLFPSRLQYGLATALARQAPSDATILGAARVLRAKGSARETRSWISETWLRNSELARAVAGGLIARHEARARSLELAEQQRAAGDRAGDVVATLDHPCLDGGDCTDLVVDLWLRSSRLTARVAADMGATYLHVLQPSQYLVESKPLSAEERKRSFKPLRPGARHVRRVYPRLLASAPALVSAGVDFADLTAVFRDHPETLYADACCHYNQRGYEILAVAIADRIELPTAQPMR